MNEQTALQAGEVSVRPIFERYVLEVVRRLPRTQQRDVAAELRSTLQDAFDARMREQAGDPDEAATVLLKDFGPPQDLAASYQPRRQHLIGPDNYPGFVRTLKICLIAIGALTLLGWLPTLADPPGSLVDLAVSVSDLVNDLLSSALTVFGLIVLIFALLEAASSPRPTVAQDWNPEDLPALADRDRIDRGGVVVEMVFLAFLLLLFNLFRDGFGATMSLDAEVHFVPFLGPEFSRHMPLINLFLFGSLGFNLVRWRQGRWNLATRAAEVCLGLFLVLLLIRCLTGDPIIRVDAAWAATHGYSAAEADRYAHTVGPVIKVVARIGLWVATAGAAVSAARNLIQFVRSARSVSI